MADAASPSKWLSADAGPLLGLRLSVSRNPWRIGPAWAVVAGALAGGARFADGDALLRLAGAILLADAAWGAIWGLMAGGVGAAAVASEMQPVESWGLPYIQPGAPIVALSERVRALATGAGCRELLAGAGLALGLAALLGGAGFWLTLAVILVALAAQLVAERGRWPALAHALLALGLPWGLGAGLAGTPAREIFWPLALGAALTILEWGEGQARGAARLSAGRARRVRLWGIWLGQAAVLAILVGLRLPWAVCLGALLFLPPSLWLLRAQRAQRAERAEPAERVGARAADTLALELAVSHSLPWWWLALLLAGLAMRQFITL